MGRTGERERGLWGEEYRANSGKPRMTKLEESFEMMLRWPVGWAAKNYAEVKTPSRTEFTHSPREDRGQTSREMSVG